jgi:uncharacterized protein YhfF
MTTKTDKVEEFWRAFCSETGGGHEDDAYQCWHFGNTPEMALELGTLVLSGKKIATAALAAVNEIKPDETPIADGFSVVTDFHGTPMCVIQTTGITHVPFDEVDEGFARDEGEGDMSLERWRRAHLDYFTREAASLGLDFDKRSVVCCEHFKVLYPK